MNNTEKPRVGQLVERCKPLVGVHPISVGSDPKWEAVGIVTSVDGNICNFDTGLGKYDSFIWRFRDGPNVLHRWGPNLPVEQKEAQ